MPQLLSQEVLVEVQHVQFVDLIKQVLKVNMQIVPKQTEKMVPQFVECQVGVAALTVREQAGLRQGDSPTGVGFRASGERRLASRRWSDPPEQIRAGYR